MSRLWKKNPKGGDIRVLSLYDFFRLPTVAQAFGAEWCAAYPASDLPPGGPTDQLETPMTLDAEGYACERGREAEEHEIPVASLFGSKHHVIKSVLPVYTTLFLMSQSVNFLCTIPGSSKGEESSKAVLSVRVPESVEYVRDDVLEAKQKHATGNVQQEAKEEKSNQYDIGVLISPTTSPRTSRRGSRATSPPKGRRSSSRATSPRAARRTSSRDATRTGKEGEKSRRHKRTKSNAAEQVEKVPSDQSKKWNLKKRFTRRGSQQPISDEELVKLASQFPEIGGCSGDVKEPADDSDPAVAALSRLDSLVDESQPQGFLSFIEEPDSSLPIESHSSLAEESPRPQGFLNYLDDVPPFDSRARTGSSSSSVSDAAPQGFLRQIDDPGATLRTCSEGSVGFPQGFLNYVDESSDLSRTPPPADRYTPSPPIVDPDEISRRTKSVGCHPSSPQRRERRSSGVRREGSAQGMLTYINSCEYELECPIRCDSPDPVLSQSEEPMEPMEGPQGFLSLIGVEPSEPAPVGFLSFIPEGNGHPAAGAKPQGFLSMIEDQELKAEMDRIAESREKEEELDHNNSFLAYLQTTNGDVMFLVPTSLLCRNNSITTYQLQKRIPRLFKALRLQARVKPYAGLKVPLSQMQDVLVAKTHKVGVLLSLEGQTEEDQFYNNEHSTPEMEQFLDVLGERVALRGWTNYDGGLDTDLDRTGTHSVYRVYAGMPFMFHVSTLLPHQQGKEQQLERKRHIGNDIVVIIFQQGPGCRFDPTWIASQFNQVFIIVRPLVGIDPPMWRLEICSHKDVGVTVPVLPDPPVFNAANLSSFIMNKILMLETLTWSRLPMFSRSINRSRALTFDSLFEEAGAE